MADEEICEFLRKTCFAKCNGMNFEGCAFRETNLGVYKGQHIDSHLKIDVRLK
jgi:hypothetical protein